MDLKNILICTKAYPEISQKYRETVCTAGLLLNDELQATQWVRIYPVRYRLLENDKRFQKWSIVSAKIERNIKDFREESYKIEESSISLRKKIKHDSHWSIIKDYLLPFEVEGTNTLRSTGKTLGLVKPKCIISSFCEKGEREWPPKKKTLIDNYDLFEPLSNLEKIPYRFGYRFLEQDGTSHKYSIVDWEIMQLYRNCRNRSKMNTLQEKEEDAAQKVQKKLDYLSAHRDLYFILGNMKSHPQNFIIIGLFYPPIIKIEQMSLF